MGVLRLLSSISRKKSNASFEACSDDDGEVVASRPASELEDIVRNKVSRKLKADKTWGYHFPNCLFLEWSKQWTEKPTCIAKLTVAGEAGEVLSSKYGGDNIAIATPGEELKDGISR